jgi:septum formation protein
METIPAFTLLLASSSPYRKALLERLRLPFGVVAPEVDESPNAGEAPDALARRLARAKADAVAAVSPPHCIVIGSDQVATLDGSTPIGKPGSLENARRQLAAASGKTMHFYTAFTLLAPHRSPIEHCVPVAVEFRVLDAVEIDRYLALEQPLDCAGSARCEGLGISLLKRISTDDPTALIGLPLMLVAEALREVGMRPT